MANIVHRVGIKAPIAKVYAALSTVEGVAGWFAKDMSGESKPNRTVKVVFRTPTGDQMGTVEYEVVKLDPNKEVHWRFKSGPNEWVGTDATFSLSQDGDYAIVIFGHRNWREEGEFMAHCSMKWATFLLSLMQLVETGKGKPSPDDLRVGNWS